MNWMKNLGAAMAVALAVGWGGMAQANLITTTNASTSDIVIDASCTTLVGCNGGTPSSTVSSRAELNNFVWSNSNTSLTFQVTLTNTTQQGSLSNPVWQGIQTVAFGFNTSPDGSTVTGGDSMFTVLTEHNFAGFNTLDICTSTQNNGNNCTGGSNAGLAPGAHDTFNITINGLNGSIDLGTDFGEPGVINPAETYDFKTAGSIGSFEYSGPGVNCPPGTPGCVINPPTDVPEPGSLALFGTALVAFGGLVMWRRRKHQNGSALPTGMAA